MFIFAICCLLAFSTSVNGNGYGLEGLVYAPHHASLDYYAYPRYAFNYAVNDPHTGDNKAQWEKRDGDVVRGAYSLVEPDGNLRLVEYWADAKSGFNAVVKKLGPNLHPVSIPAPLYGGSHPLVGYASGVTPISVAAVSKLNHEAITNTISANHIQKPTLPGPIIAKSILQGPIVKADVHSVKSVTPSVPMGKSEYQAKVADIGTGYHGLGHAELGYGGINHNGLGYGRINHNGLGYAGINHNGLGYAGINHNGLGYAGINHNGLGYAGINHNGLGYAGINHNGLGYGGINHNGLRYAGINHNGLGYAGINHNGLRYAGINHNGLGYAGINHNRLGYAGINHNGLGYAGINHYGLGYGGIGNNGLGHEHAGLTGIGEAGLSSNLKPSPLLNGYGRNYLHQSPLAPAPLPSWQIPLGLDSSSYKNYNGQYFFQICGNRNCLT